jgi:hypothetical protein
VNIKNHQGLTLFVAGLTQILRIPGWLLAWLTFHLIFSTFVSSEKRRLIFLYAHQPLVYRLMELMVREWIAGTAL